MIRTSASSADLAKAALLTHTLVMARCNPQYLPRSASDSRTGTSTYTLRAKLDSVRARHPLQRLLKIFNGSLEYSKLETTVDQVQPSYFQILTAALLPAPPLPLMTLC